MAQPKNIQRLKAVLAADPLHYLANDANSEEWSKVAHRSCLAKINKKPGRKVPLYAVTNYNEFHTCSLCNKSVRYN